MDIRKEVRRALRQRSPTAEKDDFGRILVVAGSAGMSGACYLTSMAALFSGAGLVTVGVPKRLLLPLTRRFTEATMLALSETKKGTISEGAASEVARCLKRQDVLAIGPGLSLNPGTQKFVRRVILASKKPMVIDADGLNAFKGKAASLKKLKAPAILTPHEREFARLFGGRVPKGDRERRKRTRDAARAFGVTIVLKGHQSVVVSPKGHIYMNTTGNPGMATGGSGDVLTGVIAAMLGQRIEPFYAACFGVFIHGLSGDHAAKKKGELSLVASDILEGLPAAFQHVLEKQ